ncbi:MAG: class II aldolase/adducin family protein [Desulfobacterales bacterium]|nr:class II aldolase/adducin family protein [Desulfobacterales bacterium]
MNYHFLMEAFMQMETERKAVVHFGLKMVESGLTTGTGGNLSIIDRNSGRVAVSPSGIEYAALQPEDVVLTDLDGNIQEGDCKPSSELGFHLSVYRQRQDVQAVVHTHSPYATTIACLGWEIPAVHYLVGFAGEKVPIAPYATFVAAEEMETVLEKFKTYGQKRSSN